MSISAIRFSRISFEPTLFSKQFLNTPSPEEKKQFEKELLLKVINFDLDITNTLKKSEKLCSEFKVSKNQRFDLTAFEKSLNNKDVVEWKFGGVQHGDDFIFGRIAKIHGSVLTIVDEKNRDFKPDLRKEAFPSNFYIDLNNHIIVYESRRHVGSMSPMYLLEALFNTVNNNISSIVISVIPDKRDIFKRIKELDVISSIEFSIRPPNPSAHEDTENIRNFMGEMRASNLSLKASSSSDDGLNIEENKKFIEGGLHLAQDGYGVAKVTGSYEENGELVPEKIQSINLPVKKDADLRNLSDEEICEKFKKLSNDVQKEIINYLDEEFDGRKPT